MDCDFLWNLFMIFNMILIENDSILSIVAGGKKEENANATNHCACYECYNFDNFCVFDDGHCYPRNPKSEVDI